MCICGQAESHWFLNESLLVGGMQVGNGQVTSRGRDENIRLDSHHLSPMDENLRIQ